MKKLIPMIISALSLIILGISLTVAWYTNRYEKEGIDANTKGISFAYFLGDDTNVNIKEYAVTNLTFFDIDNLKETPYFNSMACIIKVDLKNTSNKTIYVDLSSTYEIQDDAYVQVLFAEDETLAPESAASISSLVTDTYTSKQNIEIPAYISSDNTDNVYTFYMYIFGVQTKDTSINDFLANTYNFSIKIESRSVRQ